MFFVTRLEPESSPLYSGRPSHQPSPPQVSSTRGPLRQRGGTSISLCWNTVPALTPDHSDLVFCVPLFVEIWAEDPAKLEYFKTIHGLVCPMMVVI